MKDPRRVSHPGPAGLTSAEALSQQPHVVIVGAGIAGLAAATGLAERGVSVEVLEREPNLGGRVAGWTESIEDGLLTIGGRVSADQGFKTVVRVFRAEDLSPIARIEPISQSDVKWAFATRLGEVFIGTRTAIERWILSPSGDALPALVSFATETLDTERPTLLGANLLAFDASTRPVLVPILAGDPRNFPYPDGADARQVRDFQHTPEGVLIQSDDRFVLVGPSGECVGLDSSNREATLAFALAVQGQILQVNMHQPDADPGRVRYQLSCVVERLDPAQGLRNLGGAFEVRARDSRINRVLAADGWLLLSNAQGTIAVSLPPTKGDR